MDNCRCGEEIHSDRSDKVLHTLRPLQAQPDRLLCQLTGMRNGPLGGGYMFQQGVT